MESNDFWYMVRIYIWKTDKYPDTKLVLNVLSLMSHMIYYVIMRNNTTNSRHTKAKKGFWWSIVRVIWNFIIIFILLKYLIYKKDHPDYYNPITVWNLKVYTEMSKKLSKQSIKYILPTFSFTFLLSVFPIFLEYFHIDQLLFNICHYPCCRMLVSEQQALNTKCSCCCNLCITLSFF